MTEKIWNEFNGQLLGFIKSKVNNDVLAEDLLQEVFIKIHRGISFLKDNSKITNWVYQITRNAIIDYYRTRKNPPSELTGNQHLPEIPDEVKPDFTNCILPFLRQLPKNDQDILLKTSFGSMSQKEYAATYGISYTAAKSRIQRARKKLKEAFVECCDIQVDKYGNIISKKETDCSC